MVSITRALLSSGLAALLTVQAAAAATEPEQTRPAALEGSSVVWCGDLADAVADPMDYGDSPIYLGNPPTGKIKRWARQFPGYQQIWIDRDNFGWITVAFIEGADERQAELEQRFPDVGVVAVEVPRTRRELRQLQDRLGERLFGTVITSGGMSADVPKGVVVVDTNLVTEELISVLELEFAGEPVCVAGPDPADVVQPGPQPLEGDGWTLVGHHRKDGPPWFRTGIATTQVQLQSLWAKAGVPGDAPETDFSGSVVLWFAQPHGSSCQNQRLDDVIVDEKRSIIYPSVVSPDNQTFCTSDLRGANHFLVALDRDRLPPASFWIQLGPDAPPEGMPRERTVVDVDLDAPGSVASKGDAHFDREQRPPEPERSGTFIETRGKTRYALDSSCGIGYLGEINSIHWVTDDGTLPVPWEQVADEDGEIIVKVRLHDGIDPHANATANGHEVRYEPVRDAPMTCVP